MARILLVEDEADLRENLEIVLTHAGHTVATAENGAEALKALSDGAPDLLITDLSMPVMDGMTLVRTLRDAMPALAEMPIIVLTALGDKAHMIEGRSAGADEYLAKPIDYQILNATIKARLSRRRQATDLKEKQFVRLFKQLSAHAADAADRDHPSAASDDPFDKIRALADAPLFGRSVVVFLDDHVPDYAGMPPATRAKAAGLMRRVLSDTLGPGDAALDLGAGAWLLAFAERNRDIVDDKIALARLHLDRVLGAENLGGGGGGPVGDDDDDVRIDRETHAILTKLFVRSAQDDDGAAARRADFTAVADRFHFEYEPIWRAKSQRIEAYQLRWVRTVAGRPLFGDDALLGGGRDPMASELFCLALEAAAHDLRALAAQPSLSGGLPHVVIPVPASALLGMNGAKALQKLTEISRRAEGKLIGFHVLALSGGDGAGGAAAESSPFATLFEVSDLVFHDFSAVWPLTAGLDGDGDASRPRLTCVDAGAAERSALPGEQMRTALFDAVRAAAQRSKSVWATGVDTSVVARQAVAAGARFLSGKSVGGGRPTLGRPKKLPASQVFMTL